MSEDRPLRVRSASPRVRLSGDHSRRGNDPNVGFDLEAFTRLVERMRDPFTYPVGTVAPRGRSPERATTTETQQCSTGKNVHEDEYNRLCEMLRASQLKHLESARSLMETEHHLTVAYHMRQNGAEGHTEQAQCEREDSQHGGGARSEFGAERYATEGAGSTMNPTVGRRNSFVSITPLDPADSNDSTMNPIVGRRNCLVSTTPLNPADSNDSAWRSTAGTHGGEDNNPSNELPSHLRSPYKYYNSYWTPSSPPSESYPTFPRLPSRNTTSAPSSKGTPSPQPSAPVNFGAIRRLMRPYLSPLQCQPGSTIYPPRAFTSPLLYPPRSTYPLTWPSVSFSRPELEQSFLRNVTRNMDLIPSAPASTGPLLPFEGPSLLPESWKIMRQPPADPPICANSRPMWSWNTPDTRNWIYQNLVTQCGFQESYAHKIVMGWLGGTDTIRYMTLLDWQVLTTSYEAGWYMFRLMRRC
ncbi:uncharacterized protein EAE98_004751 [Botrytis deweyae]|uniref:SAM domain-containing protein n=1 Tax=Botrytis deweyae TaxID=2478750 RepID=A0ABQ7IQ37_9HELO|nr:uncharacterized protein EAE98_004751 [Botrytis deweyae]KAF7930350.1 hypothetical protein EAE98_004751 [Botrytis deweyae]